MKSNASLYQVAASHSYSPTVGKSQFGYRAISGEIPSSGERVYLRAWALVYPHCVVADSYYDLFVGLFGEVNRNGIVAIPIDGIVGENFANMSERLDLIGERATIWVTSMLDDDGKRGAVLAAVSNNLVHLLTMDSYVGVGNQRATYLLEDIVHNTAARVADLKLSPTADTMGRLPILQDIADLLNNARVDASWYKVGEHETRSMSVRDVVRPLPLQPGDTIRVISPSWFGGESFVPRASRGVRLLESLGFMVEIGRHAFGSRGHVSGTVQERCDDLHAAFADSHVKMVVAPIGGTHAADLLPQIDFELIRNNPKIFMGFSDNTILHTAFRVECGLATLYGPGLLTDWSEHPGMPEEALRTALHLMTSDTPLGPVPAPGWWTDEFLDWESGEDPTRERSRQTSNGHLWVREGQAAGRTIGGCLETLQHLRGTRWWPDFDGTILCIETSEECQGPLSFDAMFGDYARMGVLDRIAGLLVARPYGFDQEQHKQFLELLTARVAPYTFPVVANMDFGHTTPMITMPLGVMVRMDSRNHNVEIVEPFVRT